MSSRSVTLVDQYGIEQRFVIRDGEKTGDVVIETYHAEDVDSIIESNKKQQLNGKQTLGKGTQTSMYKLGELSNLQAFNLMQQGIFFDDKALRKWFNDLDNYLWRTVDKTRKGGKRAVQSVQNS